MVGCPTQVQVPTLHSPMSITGTVLEATEYSWM